MIESHSTVQWVVVRHGETDWNQDARMQGHADIPLNAQGRAQAQDLARALAQERFTAIYSSDLSRASETARAVHQHKPQTPYHTNADLRERHYGAFQGKTLADIEPTHPEQARRWRARDPIFTPEGGESLIDFNQRIQTVFRQLSAENAGGNILVLTHGGVLDVLWRWAHNLPLDTARVWALPNTGINRLHLDAQGQWSIQEWANTQHLQEAASARDETIA